MDDNNSPLATAADELPPSIARTIAPLQPAIFGIAVGIVSSVILALMTAAELLLLPHEERFLGLLGTYLIGYSVSPGGIGMAIFWGFVLGWLAGWLLAAARNTAVWLWLELVRIKANLGRSDFLDDIS